MLSAVDWMSTEKRACVQEWSSSRLVGNSSITRIREELPVTLEQSSKSQRKTGGRATVLHFLFSSASQFTTNAIGSGGDGSNMLFIQEVLFVGRDIAARRNCARFSGTTSYSTTTVPPRRSWAFRASSRHARSARRSLNQRSPKALQNSHRSLCHCC